MPCRQATGRDGDASGYESATLPALPAYAARSVINEWADRFEIDSRGIRSRALGLYSDNTRVANELCMYHARLLVATSYYMPSSARVHVGLVMVARC